MKVKLIGIIVCMLLFGTILPVNGTFPQKVISISEELDKESVLLYFEDLGVSGVYESRMDIPSPDDKNYNCLMYCNNNEQVSKWITQIDESGFERTWLINIIKFFIFYLAPGTIILFGLDDFIVWYIELLLIKKHKNEYLNFLNSYDELNDSGMITYIWFLSSTKTIIDFKIQPDNTWIEDSWILDNSNYIPNPDIWKKEMSFVPF